MNRAYLWILVFLFVLSLACGNSSAGSQSSSGEQEGDGGDQEQASQEKEAAAVGQDVIVGDIRWKFLEATDLGQELKSDNQFIDPKTTAGRFVKVRFEIENRGTEAATYAGIEVVDGQGRTFKTYDDRITFTPQGELCVLEQLNPNLPKTCTEIFEVPADATGLKAKAGDLELFGGEEALVDLGL